ncbi:MAG: glycosyltransferase family 2 protein [Candidatus Omnitrophota bacterium]
MRICVIIPTYNESKAIAGLVSQIRQLGFEVIIIDDGSKDGTALIAEASGAGVLRNAVNSGKGASLIKGYNFAVGQGFDAVISMDGDGQHSCQDIMSFVHRAQDPQSALILGNRMSATKGMPFLRVLTNRFMSGLISLIIRQHVPDTQCGFRLVKKEVLNSINLLTSKYETESEILIRSARLGFKIDSIPIATIYSGQKSQINPWVDTFRFMRFIALEFFKDFKLNRRKAR